MRETDIEAVLKAEGYYVSTTSGFSMWPMLSDRRDRVILRPLSAGERLKKYDLPLYRRPDGKYILHRVIGVKDGYYVIRGDNTYQKELVPDTCILGVMTEFYRKDRPVSASSRPYRLYAAVWQALCPARRVCRFIKRGGLFLCRRLRKKKR